ncbi:16S rRNA processing protein RimM [Lachnospiraceae bacterium NK3A20]|jgi:16S rRNA processing protein RimM|nr:16S rRNA processing protein RimM [Lachnospiraceae bacterium NK3A20]
MTDRFQVGEIAGTHGVRGDVKVFPTTDDPRRFKLLKTVYIDNIHGALQEATVSNVRMNGKFVIVHLSGYETVEDSRILHGKKLLIDRKDAMPLAEGRYYIPDLVGLHVIDENDAEIGIFADVVQTGANDVYVVRTRDARDLMIPAIRDCILETNLAEGYMRVHLLPGLEKL